MQLEEKQLAFAQGLEACAAGAPEVHLLAPGLSGEEMEPLVIRNPDEQPHGESLGQHARRWDHACVLERSSQDSSLEEGKATPAAWRRMFK